MVTIPFYSLISFTPSINIIMINIKTISSYHTMLFRMSLDKIKMVKKSKLNAIRV